MLEKRKPQEAQETERAEEVVGAQDVGWAEEAILGETIMHWQRKLQGHGTMQWQRRLQKRMKLHALGRGNCRRRGCC